MVDFAVEKENHPSYCVANFNRVSGGGNFYEFFILVFYFSFSFFNC